MKLVYFRCHFGIHAGNFPDPLRGVRGDVQEAGGRCLQTERYRWNSQNGLEPRFLWQWDMGKHPQVNLPVLSRLYYSLPSVTSKILASHLSELLIFFCIFFRERMGEGHMIESARDPHCPKVSLFNSVLLRWTPVFIVFERQRDKHRSESNWIKW